MDPLRTILGIFVKLFPKEIWFVRRERIREQYKGLSISWMCKFHISKWIYTRHEVGINDLIICLSWVGNMVWWASLPIVLVCGVSQGGWPSIRTKIMDDKRSIRKGKAYETPKWKDIFSWIEVWDSRSTNLQSSIMGMNSKICTFQFINAITPIMPWL